MRRDILGVMLIGMLFSSSAVWAQETQPGEQQKEGETADDTAAQDRARQRDRFAQQGVQVGQDVPELTIYDLDGEETALRKMWKDKPVLLVTASLTCPVARQHCPELKPIIDEFKDQLNVVILYTVEAHPKGDESPYRPGKEWTTPVNEREGILHPQPKKLEERIALAKTFDEGLEKIAPIVVDTMENKAWKELGGGPNMGLLIGMDGTVVAKHGWLNPKTMKRSVETLLGIESADEEEGASPATRPAATQPAVSKP